MSRPRFNRRRLFAGAASLAALAPAAAYAESDAAMARGAVPGAAFGLVPDAGASDQSAELQQAVVAAAASGLPLFLAGGSYAAGNVELPSSITVLGVKGATRLLAVDDAPVFWSEQKSAIALRDLGFDAMGFGAGDELPGLLAFRGCESVELSGVRLQGGRRSGLYLERTSGRIVNATIHGFAESGIFALDNWGLNLSRNRIFDCGNGGIRVWGRENGHDGTIVAENEIFDIRTDGGGNGQNGNGINVFRADGVIVANNVVKGCAFSAIRLNSTNDTHVTGNSCLDSGEVAIFSEFAFSGSIIAGNSIDGAAQGISITNFDQGGRLATCTGNIVRNIYPSSRVNPDTTAAGIFAEADAVIAANVVEAVPGLGIGVGWGPYLRDVAVTGNVVRDVEIGIGVSVAPEAGRAVVTGNLVSGARQAGIAGLAWWDTLSDDLARDANRFPNVTLSGNSVG